MKLNKAARGRTVALLALIAIFASLVFSMTSSAESLASFSRSILSESYLPIKVSKPGSEQTATDSNQKTAFSENNNYLTSSDETSEEDPIITTDKTNYSPGETIIFSGSNWAPDETVIIVLRKELRGKKILTVQTKADDDGHFTVKGKLPEKSSGEENEEEGEEEGYTVVATGTQSKASAQAQIGRDEEEEDDADLPAFMIGKINKDVYFRRRDEHINILRGFEKGKPFNPKARGKAIKQLDRQEGLPDKNTYTIRLDDAKDFVAEIGAGGAIAASDSNLASSAPSWTSVGPAPIPNGQTFNVQQPVSGRVTSIAVHPTIPDIAYVGTAQGGVYRTLDGGASWTAIFDNAQALAVGSVAISPSQPSTIYVGTGEGNFSCDSYFGVGVYRIDNADGSSPTLTGPFSMDGSNNDVLTGRSVSKILVHPANPDIIFIGVTNGIGGMGCDAGTAISNRGLYRSTNATSPNATFQKLTLNTVNGGNRSVTDIEFEPGNPNTMLATVVGFSTANDGGVYRTTNALTASPTFTQTLSAGSATATARVEIAINKVGGNVTVYAATSDANGTVKRSTDGGVTWSGAIANAQGFCGTQCTYDMPIAVDPTNANVIYIGGNADGTSSAILKKSTNATGAAPTFAKVQTGLHADSHAIEIDPSNNNTVWFGSDGGVWKSTSAAVSWISLNNVGFNATQFQSLALHPTDPNYMIGGTQDNGTERMKPDGTWTRTDYGDGGFALIDQNAANTTNVRQYHTYFNQVGTGGLVALATSTSSTAFENWTLLGCGGTANGLNCTDTAVAFYAPMALGPGNPNTVYFGTDRLYRSTNSGTTMTVVSQAPFVSGVAITAIGISPQNDGVRIVGLRNGKVYRTTTGGAASAAMTDVTGTIPARYVSRTVIDPNNQNIAYVTLSAYFGNTTAHIYKTTNLGAANPTWTAIDGNQIPDVPVNAFAVDPADSNTLYAGTDIGVYRSTDGGATWSSFSNGLPRVAVFDIAVHNASRKLRIATHGRGMWEISVAATPAIIQGVVTDSLTNAPVANAKITAGSNSTMTDENGFYQFQSIPAGTYSLTVSAIGYNSATAANVVATNASVTTKDFALSVAPSAACPSDTNQSDFQTGLPSNVDMTTSPGNITLDLPPAATVEQTTIQIFSNNITATTWQAQTFVPTATGKLTQMDFQAALATTVTGTLVVEIRNTVSGVPGGTVLATANLTTINSTGNLWYTVNFASPASVTSGTQYALVFRAGTGGPFRAVSSSSNVYANGNWQQSSTSGASWANVTSGGQTLDLVFRAYVIPQIYATDGNLVSSPKDANQADGTMAGWSTLSWSATTPAGTGVKFQAAAGNNPGGLFTFVGPDGTPNTFFTNGGSLAQFNGFRYLKYKAYLSTSNTAVTPILSDVTICNSNTPLPATSLNISPATGSYGGTTTLVAILTSGGNPLIGKPVIFKLNGASFSGNTAVTDASGAAIIPNVSLAGLNAGTYANYITAKFASDSAYAGSSGANTLTVEKATPIVNWSNPASITYGTPLSGTQLNATASLPGIFDYNPPAGNILNAGSNQILSVKFSPTDAVNYNQVIREVVINVSKADQTITFNALADKTYGDAPFTVSAMNSVPENPITFSASGNCSSSGTNGSTITITGAGNCTVTASQSGNDNYNAATDVSRSFSIAKATATISLSGLSKTYNGTPQGATVSTNPAGLNGVTVTYNNSMEVPINAGTYSVIASLNNANYQASDAGGTLIIGKASQTITWNNPANIVFGTPLGAEQLNAVIVPTGVTNGSPIGAVIYTPPAGTILNAGNNQTLKVIVDGTDNYLPGSKTVMINVVNASSAITVSAPAFIAQGGNVTISALLTGVGGTALGNQPVTLSIGAGAAKQSCTATTGGDGAASCVITNINQPLGPNLPVNAAFAGNNNYLASSAQATTLVFAYAGGNGAAFVISENNAVLNQTVYFWGSQWFRNNSAAGDSALSSFKGFANRSTTVPVSIGATWISDPGNSSNPPATIPLYMAVIASNSMTKAGFTISGNVVKIVILKTDAGYGPDPSQTGTGTVIGVLNP
jgi:hypothetical protein